MANEIGVTKNDDGSYGIQYGRHSRRIDYEPGGGYRSRKDFLRAAKREGVDIPQGKWEREKYFKKLDDELGKADKYNRTSIDASRLPSSSDSDEGGSERKKSGWF